jgi:arylamine N-acetyltransferase
MNGAPIRLDAGLTDAVLALLGISGGREPSLALLDELVTAYTRRVPWESASRIAKKANVQAHGGPEGDRSYARWPEEFWRSALDLGTGGTCFESNYAFLALLKMLGFDGYLTVNNMESSIGCHAALVFKIDGAPWLADVGLPLYAPLPLDPDRATVRRSVFHNYSVLPSGPGVYQIERDQHPRPYCFTLIDEAIPEVTYRQVVAKDYGPQGLFLDRVIISKVIEGQVCRFNGGERPFKLERFRRGYAGDQQLAGDLSGTLARVFNVDRRLLRQALGVTGAIQP